MSDYYLEIKTPNKEWIEYFHPGKRSNKDILHEVQDFLDNYDKQIAIHVYMPNEEHKAVVE